MPGFNSVRDESVDRYPSSIPPASRPTGVWQNAVYLASTELLGLGVILGIATHNTALTPVNVLVAVETATGSYQDIAGATANGSIYTKSGSFIQGPLEHPNCKISATG